MAGNAVVKETRHLKQGYWRLVWRQFRKKKLAMMGLCVIVFLVVVALLAPVLANDVPIYMVMEGKTYWLPYWVSYPELVNFDFKNWEPGEGERAVRPIVPYSPLAQWLDQNQDPPSREHWLGMDDRGRDVLARMIWGTRISMSIGIVAVGIAVAIGVVLGALAGYYGGWVDIVLQRVIEVMMCFPTFFLILAVIAFLSPNILNIMVVLGLMGWTGIARLVRGEFMKLRGSEFALAAKASGLRDVRVMFRHLLPNALAPVLVSATFGVAGAILTESGLSFLGFGVQPPTPSWGDLLKQANELVSYGIWWLVVFPGAAVFITVTAFNLVGEGLRDAMDPRLRE
jgi:peptide/nickel transport system permease protein